MMEGKTWTVLIYAAGNNDLEETIYRQFQLIREVNFSDDINVVIQLGRLSQQESINSDNISSEKWGGSRCYVIKNKEAFLLRDLGNINMADPISLLDFLIWGSSRFPSEHLMVIMSGHSLGFLGFMLDCFEKGISLMSIQGFTKALSLFHQESNKEIDILLLDTCFMNLIEVWYEIAIISEYAVKYIMLSQGNPPCEGLPWPMIINELKANDGNIGKMENLVVDMIMSINKRSGKDGAIFAICLIKEYFVKMKIMIDQLAGIILEGGKETKDRLLDPCFYQKNSEFISFQIMLDQFNKSSKKLTELSIEILKILSSTVLYPTLNEIDKELNLGPSIYLPNDPRQYFQYQDSYDRMLFCSDNRWLKVLQERCFL